MAAALPGLLDHGGYRRVLVVSHTMVHRAIAAHFGGSRLSTRERSNYIEPCAYSEFELDERGAPVAVRLNQMEHLKGLNGGIARPAVSLSRQAPTFAPATSPGAASQVFMKPSR